MGRGSFGPPRADEVDEERREARDENRRSTGFFVRTVDNEEDENEDEEARSETRRPGRGY